MLLLPRQVIYLAALISAIAFPQLPTFAQITADNSLPNNSQIINFNNIRTIRGGTQAGSNLFHSFSEFSVPTGSAAYFNNASDIQNIFSRVTGSSASNINGLIAANGNANLFLINPNGIIFGNNARLNIGGSFLATTASSLKFADGTEFNTTTQNTPLLSIGVPLGLQFGENPKAIVNESGYGIFSIFADFFNIPPGLKVEPGRTLGLVGGEIVLQEGALRAPDGRIELGGVGSGSFVSLTASNSGYVLGYEGVKNFQDIRLSKESVAFADGNSGGSIQVQGRNVVLADGSFISANLTGKETGSGLSINASESLQIIGKSIDGLFLSGLRVGVEQTATGQAGDIRINTPLLLLKDGAQITVGVFGPGKGGNLIVNASKEIQLIGQSGDGRPSGLFSETLGTGNAGDITITTPVLWVRDGAQVNAGTSGTGKGGNLTVNVSQQVQLLGRAGNGRSGLLSGTRGTGNAGNITITTPVLQLQDEAQVNVGTRGTGKGGNLTVNASILLLRNGSQILVGTFGEGQGGNLTVNASKEIQLIGSTTDNQTSSGLFSTTQGRGNAGDITITTPLLQVQDGAVVNAGTRGSGKGGNLTVNASKQVQLVGTTSNGKFSSGLFTRSEQTATGAAGSLTITTPVLLVQDGAKVDTTTLSTGKGGNLIVNASKEVQVTGSSTDGPSALVTGTTGTENAGDLTVNTPVLLVRDGASVNANTTGAGKGGNLIVNASESVELIGRSADGRYASSIGAATLLATGQAGNLRINTPVLLLKDGAQISVGTFSAGKGGNLTVNASKEVQLIGTYAIDNTLAASGLFSETQGTGDAGDISITTPVLLLRDGARIDAGTRSSGQGGNLTVNSSKQVQLTGTSGIGEFSSGLFTRADRTATGEAGLLTITTPVLLIQNGATVSADTLGNGRGGNIEVTADRVELEGVSASGQSSTLGSETRGNGSSARAGDVTLKTRILNIRDGGFISTFASNQGQAGNITIRVDERLSARDGSIFTSSQRSSGGSVDIKAQDIRLFGNSDIFTSVFSGVGSGGNIQLTANSIIAFDDSDILAFARDGRGGNITLNTRAFFGENYRPAPRGTEPRTLDGNQQVDVNATGEISSGVILLPDTTSIQNNLAELPNNLIDTNALIANSCIARSSRNDGTFTITGSGGIPYHPGDLSASQYSTGTIRGVENTHTSSNSTHPLWQKGDPIIEPSGVYRLANGKLVMSRECR
ncbi:filamentous hemagglutinin N-terminal domain-containing protein [Scytonema sp. UIC 10036]|uniref:two-partner secretion domain-containing protein n=1 Tax=Scytonema sp. UIC 10036 TaxID=2304196 RepID=UPI0012DA4AEE|nr:filamentous hemagglutinin N-terminal domain-containing protein [Scytonema sp. UIC 10036]MUG96797.1 filamentous hemagglutinin N-terminal domain-containing protein [Scytonema sp. UIC 10036]